RFLQDALHRASSRLHLPPMEVGAIVRDVQSNGSQPVNLAIAMPLRPPRCPPAPRRWDAADRPRGPEAATGSPGPRAQAPRAPRAPAIRPGSAPPPPDGAPAIPLRFASAGQRADPEPARSVATRRR